ncbi:MAG TPA: ABC transporter ATP-binding protein [Clostridiales bacterium]|jgi:ABC-type nitrate/sulfonate/bicarbonate transport system ATPase subunit|nr:ABC transporter ATP-binding protein [Clostridiales bacterium]
MVRLKDVTFSFGDRLVLDSFSIELPNEGITCLLGPSGCGKTTLFRLIAGLIRPQLGEISVDFNKISFMFQEDRLLPWLSALENVRAVLPADERDKAGLILSELGLGNELNTMPPELSAGMKRRVALARALAFGGDLLLLDEPFTGLEPELMERLASHIKKQSRPVYVITHSEKEVELLGGRTVRLKGPPLKLEN